MKRNIIIGLIVAFVLVGAVSGAILTRQDTTIDLSTERKQALESRDIQGIEVTPTICNDDYCHFTLYKEKVLKKKIYIPNKILDPRDNSTVYLTDRQIQELRDRRIKSYYESLADKLINRTEITTTNTRIVGGQVTTR